MALALPDPALVLRLAIGAVGAVVLVRGARIYRPALAMSAFGACALGTAAALVRIAAWVPAAADPTTLLVAALIGGVVGVVVVRLAHGAGLAAIGAMIGAVAGTSLAVAFAAGAWWAGPVGAVIGAAAMPFLFDRLLPVTTPAAGAALITAAVGWTSPLVPFAVLYGLGVAAQIADRRPAKADDGDDEDA